MEKIADFRSKVRTAAYLFRFGWLDLETATDKLDRYAARSCVDREIAQQIVAAAFADIEIESVA